MEGLDLWQEGGPEGEQGQTAAPWEGAEGVASWGEGVGEQVLTLTLRCMS